MLTDAILRLKVAFANLPMKGLFFWEGLLFLKDDEYKKIVEKNFIDEVEKFPKEENEAKSYYQEVLEDLRAARKEIFENPEVRNEVEQIREALIDDAAHETMIDALKENIKDKEKDK